MSDNLAKGIALAAIIEKSMSLKAVKPRDHDYMGAVWEVPEMPLTTSEKLMIDKAYAKHVGASHYCKVCGAAWHQWPDGNWSLKSSSCGKCCDIVPMGDQIQSLCDDVPARVYVSWAGQNPRFWSTTPPDDMVVTIYVKQSELDSITEDRDCWHQSEQDCARQFTKVQSELDEALDALAVTFHCLKQSYPETLPFSNTTVMGRDVSGILIKHGRLT